MNHIDLFSGIGGFALAASWVWGHEHNILTFCEKEPFCQKVLKKHWPDVPIHDDIETMKGSDYGTDVTILTGGFPCQPFSQAGKRKGQKDDRYLWPEMLRVIQETKPKWVIGENVYGIINIDGGMVFEQVLSDLEDSGYEVTPFIIPACGVDAPHKRDRVWIVANNDLQRCKKHGVRKSNEKKQSCVKLCCETLANTRCFSARNEKNGLSNQQFNSETQGIKSKARHRFTNSSKAKSNTFSQYDDYGRLRTSKISQFKKTGISKSKFWKLEPSVGRVAHGVPNRTHRLRALGNAIVPQVVVPIMQAIKQIEETQ